MVDEMPMLGVQVPRLRNGHITRRKTVLMFLDRVEVWERRPTRTPQLRTIGISDVSNVAVVSGRFRWDLIIECAAGASIVVRGLPKGPAYEAQRRLEWLVRRFAESNAR